MMMQRSLLVLLLSLLLVLLTTSHASVIEVDVDASGATATKDEPSNNKKKRTYIPEVIQLATTFPSGVLGEDLALQVAAKILFCQKSRFLLETFVRDYDSAGSDMLHNDKETNNGPKELLTVMGEIVQGIADADHMYDDITPGALMKQMQSEGYFDDVHPDIMVMYQLNPQKIQDDTKEGLLYEFIAIGQKAGYITIGPEITQQRQRDKESGLYEPMPYGENEKATTTTTTTTTVL